MEDSLSCDGQVDASELSEVDLKRRLRLMHRAATAASKGWSCCSSLQAKVQRRPRSKHRAVATASKVELLQRPARANWFVRLCVVHIHTNFLQEFGVDV